MGDQRGDNSETLVPRPNLVENFCNEFGASQTLSEAPSLVLAFFVGRVFPGGGYRGFNPFGAKKHQITNLNLTACCPQMTLFRGAD
jgi:hypothetical protein